MPNFVHSKTSPRINGLWGKGRYLKGGLISSFRQQGGWPGWGGALFDGCAEEGVGYHFSHFF